MKKFFIQLSLLSLLVFLLCVLLDKFFTHTFKKGKTNKVQWLDKIEGEHYDLAIIGSSRAWWNIDMNLINEELNISSINLSSNHFSYSEMLLRMKRFYENNNTIGKLMIQTEYWAFYSESTGVSTTVYDFLPYLDDKTTYAHLSAVSDEWFFYKNIPFYRYAKFNFQWGLEELIITQLKRRNTIFDKTGTFFSNNTFYGNDLWQAPSIKNKNINRNLLELVTFCESKNIELCVYTSPIYNAIIDTSLQKEFSKEIKSMGIDYLNYIDYSNDSTSFNDNTHLSIYGGRIFSEKLIQDISPIWFKNTTDRNR